MLSHGDTLIRSVADLNSAAQAARGAQGKHERNLKVLLEHAREIADFADLSTMTDPAIASSPRLVSKAAFRRIWDRLRLG